MSRSGEGRKEGRKEGERRRRECLRACHHVSLLLVSLCLLSFYASLATSSPMASIATLEESRKLMLIQKYIYLRKKNEEECDENNKKEEARD